MSEIIFNTRKTVLHIITVHPQYDTTQPIKMTNIYQYKKTFGKLFQLIK